MGAARTGAARTGKATCNGRRGRRCWVLLAVALALPACATRAGFQARMAAFAGAAGADLVAALGVPTGVHGAGGRRFLEFEDRRLVAFHGGRGWWGSAVGEGFCATTFALRGGRVESFAFRGDSCVAPMPG